MFHPFVPALAPEFAPGFAPGPPRSGRPAPLAAPVPRPLHSRPLHSFPLRSRALWLTLLLGLAGTGLAPGLAPRPAQAETPLAVEVVTAHTAPVSLHFALSGTIEAAEEISLGFRTGGRVVTVLAEVGQQVGAGQVLAEIDPTQARAAERAAEAQYEAAAALLAQAVQARVRNAELTSRGAATQAALDAAIEAELSAASSRDQAQAQLAKARQAVADTRLVSPAGGIITARAGEPGQIVGAAQTVLSLAREGAREAVFYVPDFPELDKFLGRQVELRSIEGSGPAFGAVVSEIAPLVAGESGTVRLKARLADAGASPGLGTAVQSEVDLPFGSAMALPWPALVSEGGQPAVWTVTAESRRVALAPVRVSRYTDNGFEVAQGLAEGALVVASGAHLLYPGREVSVVGEPK